MIFTETHAAQVLDGRKRQTRRPVKPGDEARYDHKGNIIAVYRRRPKKRGDEAWYNHKGRLLWQVGKDYAVQPGRGKRSIGRTPPVEEIRRERLGQITRTDISAEGVRDQPKSAYSLYDARSVFARLWDSLYRKPYRWVDDPEVWALEFERVKEAVYE